LEFIDAKRVRRVRDKRPSLNESSLVDEMDVDLTYGYGVGCMMK
jgi:hypothetical protein